MTRDQKEVIASGDEKTSSSAIGRGDAGRPDAENGGEISDGLDRRLDLSTKVSRDGDEDDSDGGDDTGEGGFGVLHWRTPGVRKAIVTHGAREW